MSFDFRTMVVLHGLRSALLVFTAWQLACAGCSSSQPQRPKPREISLADFAGPAASDAPADQTTTESTSEPQSATVDTPPPTEIVKADDAVAPSAAPSSEGSKGARELLPGDQVLVDGVIGQVSGKPIFADEFLEPVEDHLRTESAKLDRAQFAELAARVVHERLRQVVFEQLVLAEAEAALSQEQQMGLLAWLRDRQENVIAESGGVRGTAERNIFGEEKLTIEQYLEYQKNTALIEDLLRKKIASRVIVSWRDVEREYRKRHAEFNAQPSVTLWRIRLSSSTQAREIEEVKRRLAAGEDFAAVAESVGAAYGGLWDTFKTSAAAEGEVGGVGEIADLNPQYQAALKGLQPGQTTEPITIDDRVIWVHVKSINQAAGRSLYDPEVQRRLREELINRRRAEEQDRYVKSLFERGIYDELNQMSERLLAIAILRYSP